MANDQYTKALARDMVEALNSAAGRARARRRSKPVKEK
jgi:hypothetical protein